jgi:dolichyl-diphosphooligosaccharide--protein glycosyltransferase
MSLVLCLLVLALGFYVRVDEFAFWNKFPEVFYYDDQPVLANGDGYYYLRMARDLVENRYKAVDELKKHPDHVLRSTPPPLISSLVAWISAISSMSLEWIAVFLPAIAGPLLIIPLYGLCRMLGGGRFMGITAAFFAVLSIQYVYRTRLGFFDTDCLNVTLMVTVTYFFMLFAIKTGFSRYFFFVSGIFFTGIFVWHWDMVRHIVIAISLFPLLVALIFFYRPSLKEGLIFSTICILALTLGLFWQGFAGVKTFFNDFVNFSLLLATDQTGHFSGTYSEVRELKIPNLRELIDYSTGNGVVFFLAVAGLILLLVKNGKKSLFLAMLVILAGLTFFLGIRFIIFFAPVTAIGLGCLADLLWSRKNVSNLMKVCTIGLVLLSAWPAYIKDTKMRFSPALMNFWPGVKSIAELTPPDAVVWSSWDAGNPLMYYARRKTVSDAQFPEGGERHIYAYMPMADENPRFSANFIQFFAENGVRGIHKVYRASHNDPVRGMTLIRSVLSAGPKKAREVLTDTIISQDLLLQNGMVNADKWLQFFFPPGRAPIFLLLHQDMTYSHGWFNFGRWDLKSGQGNEAVYHPCFVIKDEKGKLVTTGGTLEIDGPEAGLFRLDENGAENSLRISHLLVQTGQRIITTTFDVQKELCFEMYKPGRFGALMTNKVAASTFNQLFIRHVSDSEHFKLIAEDIPRYQVWQVQADHL